MAPTARKPVVRRSAVTWASMGALGMCGMVSSFVLGQGLGVATKAGGRMHAFVGSRGIMGSAMRQQHRELRGRKATRKCPSPTMIASVKVPPGDAVGYPVRGNKATCSTFPLSYSYGIRSVCFDCSNNILSRYHHLWPLRRRRYFIRRRCLDNFGSSS